MGKKERILIFCSRCGQDVEVQQWPGFVSSAPLGAGRGYRDSDFDSDGNIIRHKSIEIETFTGECGHSIKIDGEWTIDLGRVVSVEEATRRQRETMKKEAGKRIPEILEQIRRYERQLSEETEERWRNEWKKRICKLQEELANWKKYL